MADQSPTNPANPPKGTSPSPAHQAAVDKSWSAWTQNGNKTPDQALADRTTKTPVDPSSLK